MAVKARILKGALKAPGESVVLIFNVPVDAVIAGIQFTTGKPFDPALDKIKISNRIPGLDPMDPLRCFSPEIFRVGNGTIIYLII